MATIKVKAPITPPASAGRKTRAGDPLVEMALCMPLSRWVEFFTWDLRRQKECGDNAPAYAAALVSAHTGLPLPEVIRAAKQPAYGTAGAGQAVLMEEEEPSHRAAPEQRRQRPAGPLSPAGFMRLSVVLDRVGLGKTVIYGRIKAGTFPAPVKLGSASVWSVDEVERWCAKQMEER